MDLQWQVYAKLFAVSVLSASVVSTLINVFFNSRKEAREHKREVNAAAASAVDALESYYCAAGRMIVDADIACDEFFREQGNSTGIGLPKFAYSDGMDWKWLPPKTVSRLRAFPSAVDASRRHLSMEWEHSMPPDHLWLIEVECAKLACKAWELARFIRDKHNLGPAILDDHDSYIPDLITKTLRQNDEAIARMREQSRQLEHLLPDAKAERPLER